MHKHKLHKHSTTAVIVCISIESENIESDWRKEVLYSKPQSLRTDINNDEVSLEYRFVFSLI